MEALEPTPDQASLATLSAAALVDSAQGGLVRRGGAYASVSGPTKSAAVGALGGTRVGNRKPVCLAVAARFRTQVVHRSAQQPQEGTEPAPGASSAPITPAARACARSQPLPLRTGCLMATYTTTSDVAGSLPDQHGPLVV
jgi:hypothetical protein